MPSSGQAQAAGTRKTPLVILLALCAAIVVLVAASVMPRLLLPADTGSPAGEAAPVGLSEPGANEAEHGSGAGAVAPSATPPAPQGAPGYANGTSLSAIANGSNLIVFDEEWMYYVGIGASEQHLGLRRVRLDGSSEELLHSFEGYAHVSVENLYLEGGRLYFTEATSSGGQDGGGVHTESRWLSSISADGGGYERVAINGLEANAQTPPRFQVCQGRAFFSRGSALEWAPLAGGEPAPALASESGSPLEGWGLTGRCPLLLDGSSAYLVDPENRSVARVDLATSSLVSEFCVGQDWELWAYAPHGDSLIVSSIWTVSDDPVNARVSMLGADGSERVLFGSSAAERDGGVEAEVPVSWCCDGDALYVCAWRIVGDSFASSLMRVYRIDLETASRELVYEAPGLGCLSLVVWDGRIYLEYTSLEAVSDGSRALSCVSMGTDGSDVRTVAIIAQYDS